jgi:hypothetical protein
MERYDWDRGFGRGRQAGRYGGGFDRQQQRPWGASFRGERDRFQSDRPRYGGYDRGIYGDDYPGYGGYPGGRLRDPEPGYGGFGPPPGSPGSSRDQGRFGGGERGYSSGFRDDWNGPRGQSRGGGWGGERGRDRYDSPGPAEPFMPEAAYLRHPEYDRPQRQMSERWPSEASGSQGGYELMDDEDIRLAVCQNLFQDNWVDAERINVDVDDGIVTLTGDVDDFLEARYAWDDAWETSGVRGVVNHIHVRVDDVGDGSAMEKPSASGTASKGKAKTKEG